MSEVIDTEGYEIRQLPWWYSPLTERQVHYDAYLKCYFRDRGRLSETRFLRLMREEGFEETPALRIFGEFERDELDERKGMFRIDQTKPTTLRLQRLFRYIKEERMVEYWAEDVEEEILAYTIIEKLEYLKIILTFSIETGVGHDVPFFAEVTCDTTIQATIDRAEIERRVVNAILKLFFCVFDADKVVKTAKKEKDPDWLIRYKVYLQKWAEPIHEVEWTIAFVEGRRERVKRGMDGFLDIVMDRIEAAIAAEGVDYFITRESFIAIGVEYGTADFEYEYPTVHVIIEKTRPTRYAIERTLIIAPSTDIWLDDILDMVISYGKES